MSSEKDFNLASWFVRSKVAKSQIDAYFAEGLGGRDSRSFFSTYTLPQYLDILDPFHEYLVRAEASIDDGRLATIFYYRNIIDCVRYLIREVAYSSDIVYAPIRQYEVRSDYIQRCIRRTGGGIPRYEIGPDVTGSWHWKLVQGTQRQEGPKR